ncbi:uncharacterized protein LOC135096830 isoform X2 [Scylla paramamosain]|uniref:uncharacterized protein LOC135096830 isoform X2 n=1 Tax=Scylla paramamosain TaxID=85552 RepID=UPI0030829EE4
MAKEIHLKYPEILHAAHPFFLSLKFVGAGGSLLDGAVFVVRHTRNLNSHALGLMGTVFKEKESGLWIYLPENNLSTIPVDVVISEVSVRYQLAAQVSVVPAGWHLHFVSPGADRLAAGVGTAVAVTHMTSLVPIQTTWLPQGQACVILTLPLPLHLPLHYIWNLVEYMYSDPSLMCLVVYPENLEIQENSVTKNLQMNVIGWLMAAPQVNPEITGLKYSKMSALEKLCLELKAAVTIRKEQSCNKSSKYFVKKVYVEGNLLHCSQENSGTHDCLQDPQRIGRHKFNLG